MDGHNFDEFSTEQLQELYETLLALDELKTRNPLDFFEPYGPQRDFFTLGTIKRERLFMAGNQTGKSTSGAVEAAAHATGLYPDWWKGKRFASATTGWACGQSGSQIRETIQLKLIGMRDPNDPSGVTGGLIPKHLVIGYTLGHGTGDLFDSIKIRHVSGGMSVLSFKSYAQDAQTWQGQTVDYIWIDEEPPEKHYNEAIARLTGKGIIFITFTPLLGYSEVVARFLREADPIKMADRAVVKMGIKHVTHFSDDEIRQRINSYPQHEREARENGDPVLGTGAIFTTPDIDITIDNPEFRCPLHWAKIWGIDIGGFTASAHPFAAVLMAWDRDTDIIYVLDAVRLSNSRPLEHCSALKRIAPDVPVAWPHDGNRVESTNSTIISNYKREGLHTLGENATFPDGSVSREAGVLEMAERMADGRFKVLARLTDWFDEKRSYHRDDKGQIVRIRDDLLDATRYALMMKRAARPGPIGAGVNPGAPPARRRPMMAHGLDFDPLGINTPRYMR